MAENVKIAARADTLVVGAGLFGCTIAAALRRKGKKALVIADQRQGMGSRPAACLMKPSWFSSMDKAQSQPSLALLDALYGLQTIRFRVGFRGGLAVHSDVHWVDPNKVLQEPDANGTMKRFWRTLGGWNVEFSTQAGDRVILTKNLVLALGIWQNEHKPASWQELHSLHGMALLLPNESLEEPFIQPWAPYRQLVAFNRGDGLWIGDGSAIRGHKWTKGHEEIIENRCLKAVPPMKSSSFLRLHGIRPYAGEKPCFLRNPEPGLWFASGGAKNGTIAAGYAAHVISEEIS